MVLNEKSVNLQILDLKRSFIEMNGFINIVSKKYCSFTDNLSTPITVFNILLS